MYAQSGATIEIFGLGISDEWQIFLWSLGVTVAAGSLIRALSKSDVQDKWHEVFYTAPDFISAAAVSVPIIVITQGKSKDLDPDGIHIMTALSISFLVAAWSIFHRVWMSRWLQLEKVRGGQISERERWVAIGVESFVTLLILLGATWTSFNMYPDIAP